MNHSQLKCGRERPACARCERLNATCNYPSPPDRRGPRTQRGPRLVHRATERRREHTRPRRPVIQRPRNESASQQTSAFEPQRPNEPLEGNILPRSDAEVDDASAGLIGTPVLSDVHPDAQVHYSRKMCEQMTDWSPVLPNSAAHDEFSRNGTSVYLRPATFTTNCPWSFFTGNILYARI